MSYIVVFSPSPLTLCQLLKIDKLWRDTGDAFVYMTAWTYNIKSKEVEKVKDYSFNLYPHSLLHKTCMYACINKPC